MPGEEKKIKEKGEEKLSKEDVRKDVLAVMAEEREKTATTENLGSIRKQVDHLEGEMGEVKKVLCAPGGGPCFTTQEQLDAYLKANDEKIGKIGTMLTEVVEKVSNMKPPKGVAPEGLIPLEPMTDEKRKVSNEQENRIRDDQVDGIVNWGKLTDNDMYRKISKNEANIKAIAKKPDIRGEVIGSLSDQERRKIVIFSCKDGVCKPFREGMEKEAGIKFYAKDDRGRFQPVDEPKKEVSHF